MLFKLSNLNSNLSLTLGYLNPALNNSAQVIFQMEETPLTGKGNAILLREVYMYIFPLVLISSRPTYTHIVVLELNFIFLLLLLAHFFLRNYFLEGSFNFKMNLHFAEIMTQNVMSDHL